jgi:hypothetical protein
MGPKNATTDTDAGQIIKGKRGRKSKKDLISSLNIGTLITEISSKKPLKNSLNLSNNDEPINENNTNEFITNENANENANENTNENTNKNTNDNVNLYITDLLSNKDNYDKTNIYNGVLNDINEDIINLTETFKENTTELKISKKRGRKPKGGKIIQQIQLNEIQKEEKQNVILHLKCSIKDLQNHSQNDTFMDTYSFSNKNDLTYELIENENNINNNNINNSKDILETDNYDDYDDDVVCKDTTKEIWKKLKQLEHNLHINNINNKRSACFWDTCEFDNPPVYIPKHYMNDTYQVYGCFCSPECGVAYLMNESIDSSTKFERYHMFNHIYSKIYDYKKNIKPAPNPYYMLDKYYGNLSLQEYRSLLRNERLFLIVDKPLTRILPELHEDNDDFILNNKIIPSNNYQVKTRLQRKKQNKLSILNENFGSTNNPIFQE